MTRTAVAWRRDLHAHPELGFAEFRTASRIAGRLADLGWDVVTGVDAMPPRERLGVPPEDHLEASWARAVDDGGDGRYLPALRGGHTAVVATLRGGAGPHVAVRADLDALPLGESIDPAHRPAREGFGSRYAGAMHACGHDGHVGMAVELAERLRADPSPGTVSLVFQPAEEGGRGGRAVAAGGLVDGVDLFVAVHLGLSLATGTFVPSLDGLLANSKLRALFLGCSAHASLAPQDGRNALLGAASATLALQGMTRVAGHETRVAVGRISGGTSSNVVPDRAELPLETRADDGAVNDAATATGLIQVEPSRSGGVASDDATALMRRVQQHGGAATYVALGADLTGAHHTSTFDFDEAALGPGVDLLERLVREAAPTRRHS